jgi:hypothetical protein
MRYSYVLACIALLLAASVYGQAPPENLEHGFQPEKLYRFSELESVNLFNGNVAITVPIGPRYPVNAYSYQLSLVYNSKVWMFRALKDRPPGCNACISVQALPHPQSNVGLGWRLSLGRLFSRDYPSGHVYEGLGAWTYESPAGDTHEFVKPNPSGSTIDELFEASVMVSRDTSTLRLVTDETNSFRRIVEFPNGERHTFERSLYPSGGTTQQRSFSHRLIRIEDAHGNFLKITYTIDDQDRDTEWELEDLIGRKHKVLLTNHPDMATTDSRGQMVSSVDLMAVSTENGDGRAVYNFLYSNATGPNPRLEWPCDHRLYASDATDPEETSNDLRRLNTPSLLMGVKLPDDSTFTFDYQGEVGSLNPTAGCGQGALRSCTVPTGATATYTYDVYRLPVGGLCGSTDPVKDVRNPGIATKTLTVRGINADSGLSPSDATTSTWTWKYIQTTGGEIDPPDGTLAGIQLCTACGGQDCHQYSPTNPWEGTAGQLIRWARTSVLAPPSAGTTTWTRSDHFFNIWSGGSLVTDPIAGMVDLGYGLPITIAGPPASGAVPVSEAAVAVDTSVAGHYLSTRLYTGCTSSGLCGSTPARSTYRTYARVEKQPASRGRLFGFHQTSVRTVQHDTTACVTGANPSGACYTQTTTADWNRVARPTRVVLSSNFPDATGFIADRVEHETATTHQDWTPEQMAERNRPWLLDTYTKKSNTEGGLTHSTYACFNAQTGFLERVRLPVNGATPQGTDVVTTFTSYKGLVDQTRYYGGDVKAQTLPLPTDAAVCTTSLSGHTPEYVIDNSFSGGVTSRSEYVDAAGNPVQIIRDLDIDWRTGLPTASRDAAGLATTYTYDDRPARLISIKPPGQNAYATSYEYSNQSTAALAKVVATTGTGVTVAMRTTWEFDALGRLARQKSLAPGSLASAPSTLAESIVEMTYDANGAKARVSEPFTPGASKYWTVFAYDSLGRMVSTTTPDTKTSTLTYRGDHGRTRTSAVNTINGSVDVSVHEEYDAQGRLSSVSEAAGPGGAWVQTQYRYDVGGRLSRVKMIGADGTIQWRQFSYDGRGFLNYESHPESAATYYYQRDSRGHPVLMGRGGQWPSPFDQRLTYDSAERLRLIETRPSFPSNEFRPFKEWAFGTGDLSVPGRTSASTLISKSKGRLLTATRWNYDPRESRSEEQIDLGTIYKVRETYDYTNDTGHVTARRTEISQVTSLGTSMIRDVRIDMDYDETGQRKNTFLPLCFDCTVPMGPVTNTYAAGRLIGTQVVADGVQTLVSGVGYHPNGLTHQVKHSNGVMEVQTLSQGMARPLQISFEPFTVCTPLTINSVTVSPQKTSYQANDVVTLTALLNGTPTRVKWFVKDASGISEVPGQKTAVLTVTLTTTATYWVEAANDCLPVAQSNPVTLTVATCQTPTIMVDVPADISLPNQGSTTLTIRVGGTAPLSIQWYRGAVDDESVLLGTSTAQNVGPLGVSTKFWVKVSNSCGFVKLEFRIKVPLTAPTNFKAVRSGNSAVLSWTASPNAAYYIIERRYSSAWFAMLTTTANTTSATPVSAGMTHAFRVRAVDASGQSASPYSNHDSVSMVTLTTIQPGMIVDHHYFDELLAALNSIRSASGLSAMTWPQLLPPDGIPPVAGGPILASQFVALRTRMVEALQALGVVVPPLTGTQVAQNGMIRAAYLVELQRLTD